METILGRLETVGVVLRTTPESSGWVRMSKNQGAVDAAQGFMS